MSWIDSVGCKYLYVIFIALLFHIASISWRKSEINSPTLSKDAISAIRRAKTNSCKKELREYASTIQHSEIPQILRRECHLDQQLTKFNHIGCSEKNVSDSSIVKLQENVDSQSDCLETCFTYGHSYGGYHQTSNNNNCLCGDNLDSIEITRECKPGKTLEWFKVDQGIFYPSATRCVPKFDDTAKPLRIAFILTLKGRSSLQVKRLLSNIYSSLHTYYLHVDDFDNYLVEQLLPLELEYSNIIVARTRFATIWGGPHLLNAIIDAFERLHSYNWSYVVNLSESDFPIKPLSDLESYLQGRDCIFLRSHNLKGYNFIKKQGLDRIFYQCERRVWRLGQRKLPRGLIYSGGSDWFALPRSFSEFITENKEHPKGLVQPLLRIFNHTLLPAETFFHTLALNSKFCDKFVDNNLRVSNWRRKQGCKCQQRTVVDWCGCSPHVYRATDINRLKNLSNSEDLFFSRKFDPTISQSILNKIEQMLLHKKTSAYSSSSFWMNIYSKDNIEDSISPDSTLLEQISILISKKIGIELVKLKTVDQYFEDDANKGQVLELCDKERCYQLLVNIHSPVRFLEESNLICKAMRPYRLAKLEVGHGFDSSERMFRDYRPLNIHSDLTVYHEWIVQEFAQTKAISHELTLQFRWINPGTAIHTQDVRLKPEYERSRLSFAHRLDKRGPIDDGLWKLSVSYRNTSCIELDFMIISSESKSVKQKNFDKLLKVLDQCIVIDSFDARSCFHKKWSVIQKRLMGQSLF